MIVQSVSLKDLPLPPSVNKIYATDFRTRRRFKSKDALTFSELIRHWCLINPSRLADAREFVARLGQGEALKFDCTFYLDRSKVLTKSGTIKKRDSSNLLKALHDEIAKILDIKDEYFLDGSYETKVMSIKNPGWTDITLSIIQIEGF
jgi:hypothetical protein